MENFCLQIIFFSLYFITLFPFLCIHLQTPPCCSSSHMQLIILTSPSIPLFFLFLSLPISASSRSVRRRFRSQTPHELWPPCWDINRRNCGGTLRLPGEMIVGSWKWGKGRGSTVTRSCSHDDNVHVLCTCTDRRRCNNGGEQFSL